jgi:RNA polymerase sigma-70 factor (ECF subfamily)
MFFSHKPRTDEFEATAMPHWNDLYRAASSLLRDSVRAQDVLQDVYMQAWKSFDQFQPGTNCRAWLFKILFYTLHHHRRKWMDPRVVKESETIIETASYAPPISEEISDEDILNALAEVPGDFRSVILLVDVEEFSYKEAAGILNVPIGTVMSRLNRCRRLLRERLAGMAQSYGIEAPEQGQSA